MSATPDSSAIGTGPTGSESPRVSAPSAAELWNQVGNGVTLIAKQDQIVWTVFGVFWAAELLLLVALLTDGQLPTPTVGLIVSFVGVALSLVWLVIEHRAMAWLAFYESVVKRLGRERLHVPVELSLTASPNAVGGLRVRPLMLACPLVSLACWLVSIAWFIARP